MSKKDKSTESRKQTSNCLGASDKRGWGLIANGHKLSFWGNVLKLDGNAYFPTKSQRDVPPKQVNVMTYKIIP